MNHTPSIMDPFSPPTNYIGTLLFLSYILAALLLTSRLLSPLYTLYTTTPSIPPASNPQIHTTALLTLLLFTTLSTTMLSVLIRSYTLHIPSLPIPPTPASLWTWMRESTLFMDFARDLLRDAQSWTWAQGALVWTFGASVWIAVEGNKRRGEIERRCGRGWMGMLVVLAQVLPVGFAVGVVKLAGGILDCTREEHQSLNRGQEVRTKDVGEDTAKSRAQVAGNQGRGKGTQSVGGGNPIIAIALTELVYLSLLALPQRFLFSSHASSKPSDTALIVYIFSTRACLALPYFIATYSHTPPTHQSARFVYLSLLAAGGILSFWWTTKSLQAGVSVGEMAVAWKASPPVSAIAVDAMVGAGAVAVWWAKG